jgi:hypothetical protein
MEREGAILAQSPFLIQKTLAEKLSGKISVMIVPPGANGVFVGENLIGRLPASGAAAILAMTRVDGKLRPTCHHARRDTPPILQFYLLLKLTYGII